MFFMVRIKDKIRMEELERAVPPVGYFLKFKASTIIYYIKSFAGPMNPY